MAKKVMKPGLGKEKMEQMVKEFHKKLEDTLKKKGVRKPNGSTLMEIAHLDYQSAFSQQEDDGKTYNYPESMFFNINSRNTFKVELRADGKFINEGTDVNGPGISQEDLIQEVVEDVATWSDDVKKYNEPPPKLKPGKWKQLEKPDESFHNLILHATYGDGWGANVFLDGKNFWIEIHNGYTDAESARLKRDMSKPFGDYSYVKEAADKLHEKVVHRIGLPKVSAMPREMNAMLAKLDPKKYPALAGAFKNLAIAGDEHMNELIKEAKGLEDKNESELSDPEKKRLEELGKEIEVQKMVNEKKAKGSEETEAGAQEKKVIDMWVMGRGGDYGSAPMQVWAQGPVLYSYHTIIAKFSGKKLFINTTKYSNTTSKLISHLKSMAAEQNIPIVEKEEAFFKTSMPEKLDFGAPANRTRIRPSTGAEENEDFIDENEDEPDEEDIFIQPHGQLGSQYSVGTQHKHIGVFDDMEDAEKAIKDWMESNKFWPNVWMVSDHGNISPHKVGSAVVKAEFELDVTYDVVTPESAERGDYEESGYESEGLKFDSLAEMALYMQNEGASGSETGGGIQNPSWYTADPHINYQTGHETTYGFHVQTDLTPEQVSELQRYMDMDERELSKLVREGSATGGPVAMDMQSAKEKWIIKDWAGNHVFPQEEFGDFEDAWGFLYEKYPEDEEALQEYEVVQAQVTATGEPDQEYNKEVYDAIAKALGAAGYKANHKEFDKYQGVYLDVSKDGKKLDTFWTVEGFVRGKEKQNPNHKYRSAVMIDEEGNEFSASSGDYFQMAPDDVFEGSILVLKDKNGEEKTIENPKKSDLPDLGEVGNHIEYEGEPNDVLLLVAESQGEDAQPMEVEVTPEGKADVTELLNFLKSKPE
jgi:hypothetical protein